MSATADNAREDIGAIPSESDSTHLRWLADRFYWAIIQPPPTAASASRSSRVHGVLPPGLLPDLADQVPVPIDELHAVCASTSGGHIVVCAVVAEHLRSIPPPVVRLTPMEMPPGLSCGELGEATTLPTPDSLNLLVGDFEPQPLRRARMVRHVAAMVVVLVLSSLLVIGAIRRERNATALASAARSATDNLVAGASPGFRSEKELSAALDRARAIARVDVGARRAPDAGVALAMLLSAWPTDDSTGTKPQGIMISPEGISFSVLTPSDPSKFLAAFKSPPGWIMDEPRLTAVDSQTRLSLRLTPPRVQSLATQGRTP